VFLAVLIVASLTFETVEHPIKPREIIKKNNIRNILPRYLKIFILKTDIELLPDKNGLIFSSSRVKS
jgi:hypothetical protein